MDTMSITEALAEIKTIDKRLYTKRQFVYQYLARQMGMKDPLGESGSAQSIREYRQSINDLEERIIKIRRAISKANDVVELTVCGTMRTISEWLVWRREVSEGQLDFLKRMQSGVNQLRDKSTRSGYGVVANEADAKSAEDIVVNVDEKELAEEIEGIDEVLGTLDGLLSHKNAIMTVEISD